MPDETLSLMRELSRQHLRAIWELSGLDESELGDEEQVLLAAMRLHPEYYDLWARLDEVSEEELERDGSNPVVHVMFHQIVENQLAANDPPETAQALDRLMSHGQSRHDAVHQIGALIAEEIYEMMKHQREFDQAKYVKKLNQLGAPRKKLKRFRRRQS